MPEPLALADLTPNDLRWEQALPVLQELRTDRTPDQLRTSIEEGAAQGLRFLAAFAGPHCVGLAGWRIVINTSAVRKLYVDDLVTTEHARSGGVGVQLLAELERRGRATGCTSLELDSGVQRYDAHRFYLRHRMHISAHHFALPLTPEENSHSRTAPV